MKSLRILCTFAVMACVAGLAYVGQQAEPSGVKMTTAAAKFLGSLTAEQKAKTTFPVDDKERMNWYFTPQQDKNKKSTRKGLPVEEMTGDQKVAALALIRAGTSAEGYNKAVSIMS